MNAHDIADADHLARSGFIYSSDGVFDTWRSHADEALAGRAWEGDCDDLASTVLDLLGRRGLPRERRFRLLCSTTGRPVIDHMVGAALDDAGRFWIVGDTYDRAYPAEDVEFLGVDYNCLDESNPDGSPVWRKGLPWAVTAPASPNPSE